MYKTKKGLPRLSRTCTNVYIDIRSTCILKGNFNRAAFIKGQLAKPVKHLATNHKVVGSSSLEGKNFSFRILSLSVRS